MVKMAIKYWLALDLTLNFRGRAYDDFCGLKNRAKNT